MTGRLLYGLIIGLATFILGLGLVRTLNARQPMSLCELDANPEAYAGQTIRFRAMVYSTRRVTVGVTNCRSGEHRQSSSSLIPLKRRTSHCLYPAFLRTIEATSLYLVDTEIVGHLDPLFGKACFGPKYQVDDAKVERVFSVKQFGNSKEAAQWVKSNSY